MTQWQYELETPLEVRGTLRADKLVVEKHVVKAGSFEVQERIDK